jgi:hypothetical protein
MHRQQLPRWIVEARGTPLWRSKKHTQQYETDARHRMRWMWVKFLHENGVTWDDAYATAADRLQETTARGSPEVMKRSYAKFKRILEASPARKALMRPDERLNSGLKLRVAASKVHPRR